MSYKSISGEWGQYLVPDPNPSQIPMMMMVMMVIIKMFLMKMMTLTSSLLPSEIPQCSPDIMQVMLLTLRAAYTRKMCSIDGVTCSEKTMEKDNINVTKLWLYLIWLHLQDKKIPFKKYSSI